MAKDTIRTPSIDWIGRRKLLGSLSIAAIAGLAGCTGSGTTGQSVPENMTTDPDESTENSSNNESNKMRNDTPESTAISKTETANQSMPHVANGGFEEPSVDAYAFFDESIGAWAVTQNSAEIVTESWRDGAFPVRSGSQVLNLNVDGRPGGVSQDIATTPEVRYRLVFHMSADPDASGALTLTADAGAASESYQVAAPTDSFERQTLAFSGASGTNATEISLTSTTTGDGPLVDDVSVEKV